MKISPVQEINLIPVAEQSEISERPAWKDDFVGQEILTGQVE